MTEKSLRQWRRERNLTQEQLARAAGVTTRSIAAWEANTESFRRASYEHVKAAATALGLEVANFSMEPSSKKLKYSDKEAV